MNISEQPKKIIVWIKYKLYAEHAQKTSLSIFFNSFNKWNDFSRFHRFFIERLRESFWTNYATQTSKWEKIKTKFPDANLQPKFSFKFGLRIQGIQIRIVLDNQVLVIWENCHRYKISESKLPPLRIQLTRKINSFAFSSTGAPSVSLS